MAKTNIVNKLFASGPLFLLYYLSISEIDTNLEKLFEVFFKFTNHNNLFLDNKTSQSNGSWSYIFSWTYQRRCNGISIRYKFTILPSSLFCR